MPEPTFAQLKAELAEHPLFDGKTWRFSPEPWPLTVEQVKELEAIGQACVEYHRGLENLYLRAAEGKNLLRNQPLLAPWVEDYLDRGKPAPLIAHGRASRNRGHLPSVLRPDLLITEEGFALTELDSVPGGIGLTALLNRLYGTSDKALGAEDAMLRHFHEALAGLRSDKRNPTIALVVSDEAATYRPEMRWIAEQLQLQGKRVYCLEPGEVFPLENALFFDADGNPEKIDIIYRFFELFDLPNLPGQDHIFAAWEAGEVAVTPPMRAFQEEKLGLGLFHHHLLRDYWKEQLSGRAFKVLNRVVPPTWIMDPAPLPPGAVLDGPMANGKPMSRWRDLADASKRERELIIKISGHHETAWGARSVVLGSDSSRAEWSAGIEHALDLALANPHVLQTFKKPRRLKHRLYEANGAVVEEEGRVRLCPYYMLLDGEARLSGALATFCPPDKKIIHGMQDAALLPCRVLG